MEDEWYSGDTSTGVGAAAGGAIAGRGGVGGAAGRAGYGDSFTPPTSHKVLSGQVMAAVN